MSKPIIGGHVNHFKKGYITKERDKTTHLPPPRLLGGKAFFFIDGSVPILMLYIDRSIDRYRQYGLYLCFFGCCSCFPVLASLRPSCYSTFLSCISLSVPLPSSVTNHQVTKGGEAMGFKKHVLQRFPHARLQDLGLDTQNSH